MKGMKNSFNPPIHRTLALALAVAGTLLVSSTISRAQTQVYFQDFDTDSSANWVSNVVGTGYSYADFYFDYSTVGIPSAPHSVDGTTRGLKLGAELGVGAAGSFPGGISVCPLDFGITENFEMRFDLWFNTTKVTTQAAQIGGAGYGTAGTSPQVAGNPVDCVFIGASSDIGGGNTSADYRVYSPAHSVSYQDADRTLAGNFSSPSVYACSNRNNTATYYTTLFPSQAAPQAQTNLFPRQTGAVTGAGLLAFKWHDVSLKKVANIITYTIDGNLIATADTRDTGALAGTNIMFNFFDINTTGSIDVDATNLLFVLFDNVRITNFPTVVTVEATNPNASETGPSPGVFTITRTSAGTPLTVNYSLTGTAVNGVDYTNEFGLPVPTSVTFAALDTTTDVTIIPVDDTVAEFTETVVLTITSGSGYVGAGSDTVLITDNDTPTIDLSLAQGTMYERNTNDYARFRLSRRGDPFQAFDVNISYDGNAVGGVDYNPVATAHFDPNVVSTTFDVHPIDNSTLDNPRTVTVSITSGTGYDVGVNTPVSASIVDDETPPETVLWSDDLRTADTSANWTLLFGSTNASNPDFTTNWMFDYSTLSASIPPAPHSGADTHGLQVTVNKNGAGGGGAGLNFYPTGRSFSGNYALRFDMFLIEGSISTTEHALFGINHDGAHTNWVRSGGVPTGWAFDGLFYYLEADGANQLTGDYGLNSAPNAGLGPTVLASAVASAFTGTFKSPPWTVGAIGGGVPANLLASATPCWADVEISQIGNVVTLTIDRTVIFSYTNATPCTSGNIMLGYDDAFDSVGAAEASVIYANARVISLAVPVVASIQTDATNARINFSAGAGDVPGQFVLQAASLVTGPYNDVSSAITSLGGGNFRATRALNGNQQFYRLKRIY